MTLRFLLSALLAIPAYGAYARCIAITGLHAQIPNTDQTSFINWVCMTGGGSPSCSAINAEFKTAGNGGKIQNLAGGFPADFQVYSGSTCSGATLAFAFEFGYSATTGAINFWFTATRHTGSDDLFSVGYDDPAVVTTQATPATVFTDYAVRYALGDGVTATNPYPDSSPHANNLKNPDIANSPNPMVAATGEISGGVVQCAGANCLMTTTNTLPNIDLGTRWTMSAWVQAPGATGAIVGTNNSSNQFTGYLAVTAAPVKAVGVAGICAVAADAVTGATTLTSGTFYYLAYTNDGASHLIIYVNGVSDGTLTGTHNGSIGQFAFMIGAEGCNGAAAIWPASRAIDEVRVLIGITRAPDWLLAEYHNQSSPSTFFTIGAPIGLGNIRHRVISN